MASKSLFFIFALDYKVNDSRSCHNKDNNSENNGCCFILIGGDRGTSQRKGVETSCEGDSQSGAKA